MKAVDFDYFRPASVEETCRLLAAGDAKIIAGGQTLVPLLAMRLARPAQIVDINRIAALQGIVADADGVTVRACTRQAMALDDKTIRARLPLLAKALGFVGHDQTRNRGTIGGSLANADPAAEIGLAALTLDAEVRARSTGGERTIPVAAFFLGPMTTSLALDECLTEIRFRDWREARLGTGFQEVSIRKSDFALSAAAVQLVMRDGICRRIAVSVGGAGAVPQRMSAVERLLTGTRLEADDLEQAAALVRAGVAPIIDPHASPLHRKRIAGTLVARAVAEAKAEAS